MNPSHILLINPWIYDFAAYDLWIKPHGLLSISSILKKYGYHTGLIDCLDRTLPDQPAQRSTYNAQDKKFGTGKYRREPIVKPDALSHVSRAYYRYGISLELFQEKLASMQKPDVVMVTSLMTYWYPGCFKVIELVKAIHPDTPVVLGGIYATLYPEHARAHSGADHVISGPGEKKALALADELTGHQSDWPTFPQSWNDYPEPDYDQYTNLIAMPVHTSKGCPFQCSFCASRLISGQFKRKDPEKISAYISNLNSTRGIAHFAFMDDALLIDAANHIKIILHNIIDARLNATFHTPNGLHAREIDGELAELMMRSNFKTVRLSYESADPERQKEMHGKVSDQSLIDALRHLENAGYKRHDLEAYIIMGLPGQSIEEVVESMVFVMSLGCKVRLTSFTPLPGTLDWERAVQSCDLDPDIDPILTNNTLYPLRHKGFTTDHFQKLRKICREHNSTISRSGVPLTSDFSTRSILTQLSGHR